MGGASGYISGRGPEICEKKIAGRGFERPVTSELNAHVPRHHRRGREHSPVLFTQHDQRSFAVSDMISFCASDGEIDEPFFLVALDMEELSGSVTDPALLPLSSSRNARLRADEELIRIMTKAVNELGLEWSPLTSHLAAGWTSVFSRGTIKPPPTLVPLLPLKFIRAHDIVAHPHWSRIRSSALAALTSVDGAEEKGYKHLPPLDESVDAHLCPPTAIGWKARASHPSKPCRATSALAGCAYSAAGQTASALHSMAVLQVFQAKKLASEETGLDAASLMELRSATILALRATKATAQAIGVRCPGSQ